MCDIRADREGYMRGYVVFGVWLRYRILDVKGGMYVNVTHDYCDSDKGMHRSMCKGEEMWKRYGLCMFYVYSIIRRL